MAYDFAAIAVQGLALAALVWWRYPSVERAARQRDEEIGRLQDPPCIKLASK